MSDTILWYAQPAVRWVEALPVGNGRIGAMVHGGIDHEYIQLNEDTMWAGGPYDPVSPDALPALADVRRLVFAGKYAEAHALIGAKLMARPLLQMPYGTIGTLVIDRAGVPAGTSPARSSNGTTSMVTPLEPAVPLADYRRELDLNAAVAGTRWSREGTAFHREVIASPRDQVIAVRLSADRTGMIDVDLSMVSPLKQCHVDPGRHAEIVLLGRNESSSGIASALHFEARVRAVAKGGSVRVVGDHIVVRGANELVVLVAMATSYRRFDDVSGDPAAITRGHIDRAAGRGYARIARDARAAHHALFSRVKLDLGRSSGADRPTDRRIRDGETGDDPALATLYFNYARYLLITSSRPGSQPANLQGIWNDVTDPPWGGKYTVNINTQMNYWPAEPTNLAECVEPLVALVRDLAVTGARTAKAMYGARGWVCHHNTDLWRATAPIDGPEFGMWQTGGAWLCTHLWDRYDYSRDTAYLASVYPLIRDAALFFVDILQQDPSSGFLVTNPSLSPENNHGHGSSICAGPTMDMSILRDLFDQAAKAASILGLDADLAKQFISTRQRLAPFKIGASGQLQEWQEDWDAGAEDIHHRHVSHLYGVYPSQQIGARATPALATAARRSLDIRGDEATGWATAWRIALWARLGDGNRAHHILRFLIGPKRTYPNMFDAHPPFQIDGNFGGAAAIAEMLLRCVDDEIVLLPALPDAWASGSVTGLRARGACEVALSWHGGRLTRATVTPSRDGAAQVRYGEVVQPLQLKAGQPIDLVGAAFNPPKRAQSVVAPT
ncbi:glycoside hydrolase family 95 protein [Sphingomonas sp. AR_OL41]|uniref:glycoside hydrolase family 95 protein n=1 Tax=Sphingomonas sp. AR_OL41 TaxID=3042729 RepID=UPI0024810122|nr:glycoside hydrolase family 95 protein [Sphingomonas sp. AR_OL41]MDH7975852.1 glycoside hydrolase family 95 protein [Sphingomonas sp. AR_OL41]